ncbi:MAG TPA: diacylglycerol kinase family protein [Pilimelia sp.]|nr:diacylglycerol kinase family protein [Pilimelia sp.]
MRALLVVNPKATTTSERSRDVLVRALRSEVRLEVAYTRRRGHAAELARTAGAREFDLVVTLGGDGTVNEVVNGLMTAGAATAAERPALAVVPGGSTNVFARALGLPRDWVEGTADILAALRDGRSRTIGLGRADDRYFTFCAGMGLDAAVIRQVERARLRGRVSTPALYLRSAMTRYLLDTERRHAQILLERPDEPAETELATVIIQNTAPWTYLGDRPVNPNPLASFDTGLDLMALRGLHPASTARAVAQMLSRRPGPQGRRVLRLHDIAEFSLRASGPQPFQLDGDYLGEREKVQFTAVADAIRVIC